MMNEKYNLNNEELIRLLENVESGLFSAEKLKFEKSKVWRESHIPNESGVYALYEGPEKLMYVGETGNLRERMDELNRTVNHTFRKQLGASRFGGKKSKKKFTDKVEKKLDNFFKHNLYVSYIEVNFGRLEIETFIVDNNQKDLLNSIKKRKKKLKQ